MSETPRPGASSGDAADHEPTDGALRRARARGRVPGLAVVGVAIVVGVAAALSPVSPTGASTTDMIVTFVMAALVTWLAAAAPWWAITAAGVVAGVGVGASGWIGLAVVAMSLGLALRRIPDGFAWLHAVAAGCVVMALLHVQIDPILGGSAIIAGATMLFLAVAGLAQRSDRARRWVLWSGVGVGLCAGLAVVGLGIVASQARTELESGGDLLEQGIDELRAGDTTAASATLREAAVDLDDAGGRLDAVWAQPARLLPVVAQHRALATSVVAEASAAATAASEALAKVDVDQLRFVSGELDIDALGALAAPLGQLDDAVARLSAALDAGDSPWLIGPVREAIADGRDTIDRARSQTAASAAVAATGPAVLGLDGPRRYLVVFTVPGAARGLSGIITNYAEVRVVDGAMEQTAFGRVDELDDPEFWSTVTTTPDMPTAASAMARTYAAQAGHEIDGVIMMDPFGLSALVAASGPIAIPESAELQSALGTVVIGDEVSAAELQQFLLVDQFTLPDEVRLPLVEAAAGAGLTQFLGADLPDIQDLADSLGAAATEGHLNWWASRPEEQEAFRLVGMAGRLPPVPAGGDGLAVVSNNTGRNLLDAYLQRKVTYRATYDADSGRLVGDLVITLRNGVPSSGLPASVIGNEAGLPIGTNATSLSIYTPLTASAITVDGVATAPTTRTELGWNVSTVLIEIAPGSTSTVSVHIEGDLGTDGYALLWRPQPLSSPDAVQIAVTDVGGSTPLATVDGTLTRTSTIDADGTSAER